MKSIGFAHRSRRCTRRAYLRAPPMPWWKVSASAIASAFAAGCVPISSNFRMSFARFSFAGVSGQSAAMFSRRQTPIAS